MAREIKPQHVIDEVDMLFEVYTDGRFRFIRLKKDEDGDLYKEVLIYDQKRGCATAKNFHEDSPGDISSSIDDVLEDKPTARELFELGKATLLAHGLPIPQEEATGFPELLELYKVISQRESIDPSQLKKGSYVAIMESRHLVPRDDNLVAEEEDRDDFYFYVVKDKQVRKKVNLGDLPSKETIVALAKKSNIPNAEQFFEKGLANLKKMMASKSFQDIERYDGKNIGDYSLEGKVTFSVHDGIEVNRPYVEDSDDYSFREQVRKLQKGKDVRLIPITRSEFRLVMSNVVLPLDESVEEAEVTIPDIKIDSYENIAKMIRLNRKFGWGKIPQRKFDQAVRYIVNDFPRYKRWISRKAQSLDKLTKGTVDDILADRISVEAASTKIESYLDTIFTGYDILWISKDDLKERVKQVSKAECGCGAIVSFDLNRSVFESIEKASGFNHYLTLLLHEVKETGMKDVPADIKNTAVATLYAIAYNIKGYKHYGCDYFIPTAAFALSCAVHSKSYPLDKYDEENQELIKKHIRQMLRLRKSLPAPLKMLPTNTQI